MQVKGRERRRSQIFTFTLRLTKIVRRKLTAYIAGTKDLRALELFQIRDLDLPKENFRALTLTFRR
jgi:hypothetical protein